MYISRFVRYDSQKNVEYYCVERAWKDKIELKKFKSDFNSPIW